MNDLEKICADAYEARVKIGTLDTDIKNKVLNDAADNLLRAEKEILEANKRDVATAEEKDSKQIIKMYLTKQLK